MPGDQMKRQTYPILQTLIAAVLFGASAPLCKLLLGEIAPIPLAAFLYLGSGVGTFLLFQFQRIQNNGRELEAPLTRPDLPWLIGAVLSGGVAAPILLLMGLNQTPASTASLLLNFESVATTLIAVVFFKETIDRRVAWAIGLVTLASILLTWTGGAWGFSLGALGVVGACFLWGLDNNLTRHISAKNPLILVSLKGLGAGTFSLALSTVLGQPIPSLKIILLTMFVGVFSYGISIQLFILAMRQLGAARTSTLFGIAPFVGVVLSIILAREMPQTLFWLSLPIMIMGAWFMLTENHHHPHVHEAVEHIHNHSHPDEHHDHACPSDVPLYNGFHSHGHTHAILTHVHTHTPDLHHIHEH
jgi:drug/metabolite transporter (DMT)-like permease